MANHIPNRAVPIRAKDRRLISDASREDDLYRDGTPSHVEDRVRCLASGDRCRLDDVGDHYRDRAISGRRKRRSTSRVVAPGTVRDRAASHRRGRPRHAKRSTARGRCTVGRGRRPGQSRESGIVTGTGNS